MEFQHLLMWFFLIALGIVIGRVFPAVPKMVGLP